MATTVTLTDLSAQLQDRATENRLVLVDQLLNDRIELAPYATLLGEVLDEQPILSPKVNKLTQRGRTAGFNPTGAFTFGDEVMKMRPFKVDVAFTQPMIDQLYRNWMGVVMKNKGNPQYHPDTFPLADYVYSQLITRRAVTDTNQAMVKGVYATGGEMDGLLTQVKAFVTANAGINIIAGAAITLANAADEFDKFEQAYVDTEGLQGQTMFLFCSPGVHKKYRDRKRIVDTAQQGSNKEAYTQVNENPYLRIVPISAMVGSNRIIGVLEGNLFTGYDNDATTLDQEYKKSERELRIFGDWAVGLQFGTQEQIWTNDYVGIT